MAGERSYLVEMEQRIADATEGTGWAVPVVGRKLYDKLLAEDPDLLQGWLDENAPALLTQAVGNYVRGQRLKARQQAVRERFRKAAAEAEQGDPAALSLYTATYVVSPRLTRKRAHEMTGPEHQYVAVRYERTGVEALMLGAFHQAVAEKVGARRVDEVLDAEQYEELFRSIVEFTA